MIKNSFIVISRLFIGLWIPRQYISIVIPVYEMKGSGTKYLKELLETIFLQNYNNYEIVISDDSKDDVIFQYIKSFHSDKLKIIKYCKNPNIAGISSNLNNAIKHAGGQIIKVMFQDDLFSSNNALLELNRAYCTSPNQVWAIEHSFILSCDTRKDSLMPKFNPYMLLGINTFSSPSTLSFRKSSLCKFNESLFMLMDVEIYVRLSILYGAPMIIKNKNIINRVWEGQSQKSIGAHDYYRELKAVAADYPAIVTKKYLNSAINNLNGIIDAAHLEGLKLLSHDLPNAH